MKKYAYISIRLLLVSCIIASTVLPSVVLLSYQVNKAEIIEKYCVNKEKPEMKCHGRCHLKTQLEKSEESKPGPKDGPPPVKEMHFNFWLNTQSIQVVFNLFENDMINYEFSAGVRAGYPLPTDHPPKPDMVPIT